MTTYLQQAGYAADANFRSRVRGALTRAAITARSESDAVVNHSQRLTTANAILRWDMPEATLSSWVRAILADNLTDTTATDADIDARVELLLAAMAPTAF